MITYTFLHTAIERQLSATHCVKYWICTDMKELCPVLNEPAFSSLLKVCVREREEREKAMREQEGREKNRRRWREINYVMGVRLV